MIQTCTYQHFF